MSNSTELTNQSNQNDLLWIGCVCSVLGNFLISVSFQLQRSVHTNNSRGIHYTKFPQWWAGFFCMGFGELGNFLAYGMAPASLVSPLGAVTVISNAILSRVVLKERLTWIALTGVLCALSGAVLITLNAPAAQTEDISTSPEHTIYDSLVSWRSIIYIAVMCLGSLYIANPLRLSIGISVEFAKRQVVCYCCLCGFMGAITVLSSKGISTAINQAIGGHPAMFVQGDICWLTYILFFSAAISIVMQMKYLNRALMNFGSSLVVPVYYIVFTTITISAGMVLFLEISFDHGSGLPLFIFGILLAFLGVYLINTQAVEDEAAMKEFKPLMGLGEEMMPAIPEAASREELQLIFSHLDRGQSGRIDGRDVGALASALGDGCAWRERFVADLLSRLASEPGGSISFDEFDRWYHDEHSTACDDPHGEEQRGRLRTLAHRLRVASDVLAVMGCQGSVLFNSLQMQRSLSETYQKQTSTPRSRSSLRSASNSPSIPTLGLNGGAAHVAVLPWLPTEPVEPAAGAAPAPPSPHATVPSPALSAQGREGLAIDSGGAVSSPAEEHPVADNV